MKAFTLIEIIITILIVAIFIAATALILQQAVTGLVFSSDTVKALNLARLEMSKINNLSYTDVTLVDGYNITIPGYEGSGYDLNRSVSHVADTNEAIKKVVVSVYLAGTIDILSKLVTYAADIDFGPGSGGNTPGTEAGQANSLSVSGGTVSGKLFQNVTLENTSADVITITAVAVSFAGQPGIKIKQVDMNGTTRWSGTKLSGVLLSLNPSFSLSAYTTYSNTTHFTFSKNLTSVTTIVFTMSDDSTKAYMP